jgi:23S rRNA-/tRNA-specific pseudouridylate synthase
MVDVSTVHNRYEKLSEKDISNLLNTDRKPFPVFVKKYLKDNYGKEVIYQNQNNICHRLDIHTSGAVMVSLGDKKDWLNCRKIISNKKCTKKIYMCLVHGIFEKKKEYIMNNIKCKTMPTYCTTIKYNKNNKQSMPSLSYYEVLEEYSYNDKYYSLVLVKIFTGRPHHDKEIIKRMFLHNIYLSVKYDNKIHKVYVPLPDDIIEALNKLKLIKKYSVDFDKFIDKKTI